MLPPGDLRNCLAALAETESLMEDLFQHRFSGMGALKGHSLGNLLLAMGLFLEKPIVIRLAAIWMIPGLFIWFLYVVLAWGVFLTSTLAHVGGLTVAMTALSRVRMDRTAWRWAFAWYLVIQLLSRLATPFDLNVNVAHAIPRGWEQTFASYWIFWIPICPRRGADEVIFVT